YRTSDLMHDAFAWHQTGATVHDHAAVVMGIQTQTSRYRGRDFSGRFVTTLVVVRQGDTWTVVNVQLSPETMTHGRSATGHPGNDRGADAPTARGRDVPKGKDDAPPPPGSSVGTT